MVYNPNTADIITVGASNEVYRLNLSLGRFQSPFISAGEELTCVAYTPRLELAATGSIDSLVEFWDAKARQKAHSLTLPEGLLG